MALIIPTTQEVYDQNIASYEGQLNQTVPLQPKAYLRVESTVLARLFTTLDRFNVERNKQNLVLTATGIDLKRLGREYGIIIKPAESTKLIISLPATTGTTIPITVDFVGDSNYERYDPDESVVAVAGVAIIPVTAVVPGSSGNLNVGDTLTIGTQVPGAQSVATVTVIDTLGVNEEDQEVYRRRLSNRLGTQGGGSNPTDYRRWSEVVPGAKAVYPYSGKPFGQRSYPMDRTIYVESEIGLDPDGIARQELLDAIREAINRDPTLLVQNPSLGSTDETMFIESITRPPFYIEIRDLTVNSDLLLTLKNAIATGLDEYFRALTPYISGIDYEGNRVDIITDVSVSRIIQDIMRPYGATAEEISFGKDPGTALPSYTLLQGELAKSGGVTYVTSA